MCVKIQLAVRLTREKSIDTRLLIGRIAFLTCEKRDTRHLIGLHRIANENLLGGFQCVNLSMYIIRCITQPGIIILKMLLTL